MTDAARAAKRRYYHKNRLRILAQQRRYRANKRQEAAFAAHLAANTQRWRARFQSYMRAQGEGGRTGQGLTPEGHRYRAEVGIPVPPWPLLKEPRKARRHSVRAVVARLLGDV